MSTIVSRVKLLDFTGESANQSGTETTPKVKANDIVTADDIDWHAVYGINITGGTSPKVQIFIEQQLETGGNWVLMKLLVATDTSPNVGSAGLPIANGAPIRARTVNSGSPTGVDLELWIGATGPVSFE